MGVPSSSRGGTRVRLVAIHTAEGARTASSLRSYFDRTEVASSHVAIDAFTTLEMVPRSRASWTLRNGNPYSVNAELCAFAGWSRADWLSTGTVQGCANPRRIVSRAAAWARRECLALGVPMVKLSPADVRAGKAGIIGHHDYTVGMRDGSHWDPGPNFPWDIFMAEVRRGGSVTPTEEDDMGYKDWSQKDKDALCKDVAQAVWHTNVGNHVAKPDKDGSPANEPAYTALGRLEKRIRAALGK